MNRDELFTRGPATLPAIHYGVTGVSVHPSDAEGGTWIGSNDAGLTFTLLNWNTPPRIEKQKSRGHVITALLECRSLREAESGVASGAFGGMRAFRLIGFFPREAEVREWHWDGTGTTVLEFPWQPHHWFSSGMSDELAAQHRAGVTRAAGAEADTGTAEWMRKLHRSHLPERGAFSICVHRDDAATLSYTEVVVADEHVTMRYRDGSPCARPTFDCEIAIARSSQAAIR